MARHERGEDGEERAVASGAAGGGGGGGAAAAGAASARQRRSATRKWRRGSRQAQAAQDPFAEADGAGRRSRPSSPTPSRSRFRRRCRRAPASPTSSSATRQNPVDLWFFDLARPDPASVHRQGKRGHRAERHGRCHRCRELRPGRMVGHLQAAPSRQRRAPRSRPESSCRSPSRSGTGSRASVATGEVSRSGTRSTSSQKWSPRPSARWCRTALLILAIELAVIGWVRWRYGSRARGELGGEPRQPAATRA